MKKITFLVSLLAGMLLSGTAFAVAIAPNSGAMMGTENIKIMQQNMQGMTAFMAKMQTGTLSSQDQKDMYKLMTTPVTFNAPSPSGNMMYAQDPFMGAKLMTYKNAAPFTESREMAWFGLMFILTVIMVWVVLLLLIGWLWKAVFAHKK